jgi:hypothetical protein
MAFGEAAGAGTEAGLASVVGGAGGAAVVAAPATGPAAPATAAAGGGALALAAGLAADAAVKTADVMSALNKAKEMRGQKGGTGAGGSQNEPSKLEPTPHTQPDAFDHVKGSSAKVSKDTGEVWVKDRLHKDHYEVYRNKKDFENGKRTRDVWLDGREKRKL